MFRNFDDLRNIVNTQTKRGVRIEFIKVGLTFSGDDSPMPQLLLSVMCAFAEDKQIIILKPRVKAGEKKASIVHDLEISRETLYQYLKYGKVAYPSDVFKKFIYQSLMMCVFVCQTAPF